MASSLSVTDELSVAFLSILVCASFVGNVSVITCIYKASRDNRRYTGRSSLTSTDVLLVSLAVNDILLAAIALPQKIYALSHTHHFFECKFLESLHRDFHPPGRRLSHLPFVPMYRSYIFYAELYKLCLCLGGPIRDCGNK